MNYIRQSAQTFHARLTSTDRGDANPPISIVSYARNKLRTPFTSWVVRSLMSSLSSF
ncbi:hypothetical protein BYT27DRAFT_7196251, partial [Phlegmacium glaucopus]